MKGVFYLHVPFIPSLWTSANFKIPHVFANRAQLGEAILFLNFDH